MTVPATARRAGPFNGNGVTTSFPFSFKVFTDEDILVVFAGADGLETTLVLDSDYSVTLNVDQDASPGGSITYPVSGAALATGETLTVVGNEPYTQELDLPPGGNFSPIALENALDRTTFQIQQLAEGLDRSLVLPVSTSGAGTELPSDSARAGRLLAFAAADGAPAASAFTEGQIAAAIAALSPGGTSGNIVLQERQTSTAGQTTITLTTITVVGGVNSCFVFIDNAFLPDNEFSVTSSTSIELTEALVAGQTITVLSGRLVTSGVESTEVSHTASGGVATSADEYFGRVIDVMDYMTEAQRANVKAGQSASLLDVTAAWELARDAALEAYGDVDALTVYFPTGRYLITSNNFLGDWTSASLTGAPAFKLGLTIRGDGYGSQIVWRPTSSADVWMYDNGSVSSAGNALVMPTLKDLFFRCEVTNLTGSATMNGFRQYAVSGAATQALVAFGCRFLCVDNGSSDAAMAKAGTFLEPGGAVNSSENKFFGCKINGWGSVLDIGENAEAVNHEFHGTDLDAIYGDVFKVAGGSSIKMFGGSCTMMSEAQSYFLALRPTTASIAGSFVFDGVRVELNERVNHAGSALSGLLLTDATSQATAWSSSFPIIRFAGHNGYPISGSARDTIKIDAALPASISFDGSVLGDIGAAQKHQVLVFTSKADLWDDSDGPFAELEFIGGSGVPHGSVAFTDANSHAIVRARGCNNTIDYDLTVGGTGQYTSSASASKGFSRALKTAFLRGRQWPDVGDNGATNKFELTLPKGSVLKSCRFRKAANAGTATAGYQLAMVDGASNVYCSSTIANQNLEHAGSADDLMIVLDDSLGYSAGLSAEQAIYVIATAGHTGSSQAVAMAETDYAMVEYW